MTLHDIRIELARTPDVPEGDANCGYEFIAPLTADGRLDSAAWPAHKADCRVRRFWRDKADEIGEIVHTGRHGWAFSYAPGEEDDEPFFRLESHHIKVGDYISVTEHDGKTRPFRIMAVKPHSPAKRKRSSPAVKS